MSKISVGIYLSYEATTQQGMDNQQVKADSLICCISLSIPIATISCWRARNRPSLSMGSQVSGRWPVSTVLHEDPPACFFVKHTHWLCAGCCVTREASVLAFSLARPAGHLHEPFLELSLPALTTKPPVSCWIFSCN